MAAKRRFLDVWLVETNTVYREVPFAVVADWVQQSRLLPDDMLRPSGTAQWFKVGTSPDFAPYVPRAEPYRAGDQAEALEPVQLDFSWRRKPEDEEDDVDMIPLIDISLVLLIFFIMTAGVGSAFIDTPGATNVLVSSNPQMLWVGIDLDRNGDPVFSLGKGDEPAQAEEDKGIEKFNALLARLDAHLDELPQGAEVTIRAHRDAESGLVRELTTELTKRRSRPVGPVLKKYITVSEK